MKTAIKISMNISPQFDILLRLGQRQKKAQQKLWSRDTVQAGTFCSHRSAWIECLMGGLNWPSWGSDAFWWRPKKYYWYSGEVLCLQQLYSFDISCTFFFYSEGISEGSFILDPDRVKVWANFATEIWVWLKGFARTWLKMKILPGGNYLVLHPRVKWSCYGSEVGIIRKYLKPCTNKKFVQKYFKPYILHKMC